MSLFKRGRIWHYDFQLHGVRHRGTTEETSKTAAREKLDSIRANLRSLDRNDREEVTIRAAARAWWDARQAHLRGAKTTAHRLETLKRCIDMEMDVRQVTTRVVEAAMQTRRAQVTHNGRHPEDSTVNRDIIDTTLRPILNYAGRVMEVKGLASIDWRRVRLGERRGRVREFTADEIAAVRARLQTRALKHHLDLFDFLSCFGVRLREAWFPLGCLDVTGKRITLRQRKGGDWHSIPLNDDWARRLTARAGRARAAGLDTVWFYADASGALHALKPRAFQSYMARLYKELQIHDARPAHDLRHHAATQFVRRTGSLKGAQRLLGHENITTTARYAHASEDDVREGLFGRPAQFSPQPDVKAS
jgi:site-specific recombinase XerD